MADTKKTCPDCGLAKIPASVTECPDCGYEFEDEEDETETTEEVVEETEIEEKPVAIAGVISLSSVDENGEKALKEICRINPGETKTFGRASKKKTPDVDLSQFVPDAGGISGLHFAITDRQLTDLGSTNGTYIVYHLTPDELAPEFKSSFIDDKFPNGWREEPPIQLQILVGIPLAPNEPYALDSGTEFRADISTFVYSEEEIEE